MFSESHRPNCQRHYRRTNSVRRWLQPAGFGSWTLVLGLALVPTPARVQADHLVLRDLRLLHDVVIEGFDEDGVRLTGSRTLTWDEILSGDVGGERQAEFDALVSRLSLPLYRLRWRLKLGDDSSLLTYSTPLLETYRNRRSEPAAIVWYSELRGRLATGDRAAALTPLLALLELRDASAPQSSPSFLTEKSQAIELGVPNPTTGLFPELLPVWFDKQSASRQWESVYQFYQDINEPDVNETLYVASLAIAADQAPTAMELIGSVKQPSEVQKQWIAILRLQIAEPSDLSDSRLKEVNDNIKNYPRDLQAVGYYALGRTRLASGQVSTIQRGLLDLLRIPAELNDVAGDLSGAAISQVAVVMEKSDRPEEAQRLWRELMTRHAQSWHARRRRGE